MKIFLHKKYYTISYELLKNNSSNIVEKEFSRNIKKGATELIIATQDQPTKWINLTEF